MRRRCNRRHLGKRFSEGARLLWLAMGETSQAEFQRGLGLAPGMLANYLYGERRAGREVAVLFQQRLGIPIESWSQASTVDFVPPAAREAA